VSTGNEAFFIGFLVIGMLVTVAAPLAIHRFRKPQWTLADATGPQPEPALAIEGK
jgi:hypothetical protein